MYTIWYINMPDVTASNETSLDYVAFFMNLHTYLITIQVWSVVYFPNFHRLCVWLIPTILYLDMEDGTVAYGKSSDWNEFFGFFSI